MRLNNTYDLIKQIGEGSTCKVWLARSVANKDLKFAIKMFSSEHMRHKKSREIVKKEVDILFSMDHEKVI